MNAPILICSDIYVNNENYVTNREIGDYISNRNIDSSIPEVRAALYNTKLWPKDTVLNVVFMGGEEWKRAWVEKVITEDFQQYSNIKFSFDPKGKKTIRISFNEKDGAYSAVGTDALNRAESDPTMNLGWLDPPGDKNSTGQFTFKGKTYTVPAGEPRNNNQTGATIQHEFGHAIGMIHEHQNPRGQAIQWDVEKVYSKFSGPPNNWNKETINRNILKKYNENQINGSDFDSKSIMLYFFPASLTKNNMGTEANHKLSELDKLWMAKAYADTSSTPSPTSHSSNSSTSVKSLNNYLINKDMATIQPTATLTPVYPQPPQPQQPLIYPPPPSTISQPGCPQPSYPQPNTCGTLQPIQPQPQCRPCNVPCRPCGGIMPGMPGMPGMGMWGGGMWGGGSGIWGGGGGMGGCMPGTKPLCRQVGNSMSCRCVPDTPCPPGFVRSTITGQCVRRRPCPPGYRRLSNGRCVRKSPCPPGYRRLSDGRCVRTACPPGYRRLSNGRCVKISRCPIGYVSINGRCVKRYVPPPGKIHIHGPRCHFGKACHGRRPSPGRRPGSGRRPKPRPGGRHFRSDEDVFYEYANQDLVENFENLQTTPTNVNYKFLVLVIVIILIAIFMYIMKEQQKL